MAHPWHHAEGIFLAEQVFGATLIVAGGRVVPVRGVGEQHIKEDLGWIPTVKDWLRHLQLRPWMGRAGQLLADPEGASPPARPTAGAPEGSHG